MKYKYFISQVGGYLPKGKKYEALVRLAREEEHKLIDEISVKPFVESWKLAVQKLNEEYPRIKPWSVNLSCRDYGRYHYLEVHCDGHTGFYITLIVITGEWMPF